MSSGQTSYKLDEAQAILSELRSIKKSISMGERERQDLIQVRLPLPACNDHGVLWLGQHSKCLFGDVIAVSLAHDSVAHPSPPRRASPSSR